MPKTPGREAIDAIGEMGHGGRVTVAGLVLGSMYATIETRALEAEVPSSICS